MPQKSSQIHVSAIDANGLVFTSDEMPGYTRRRCGSGFSFRLPDGSVLKNESEKRRIRSLAIPPAYEDVWICMDPDGHLQATGLDARARKQYRYHPGWHEHAARVKFGDLSEFAITLPKIRDAYRKALTYPDLDRDRVTAGIVFLLDTTGYRIGSTRYEKENRTYGLSSLLTRHVRKQGESSVSLKFRGKGGQEHEAEVSGKYFAKLVGDLHELPGQHLFRYEDESGTWHDVGSADVNAWIKEKGGGDHSAKQFRTWKATVLCARELGRDLPAESHSQQKKAQSDAIRITAGDLNHTPTTSRKFYIHPAVFEGYVSGALHKIMNSPPPRLRKSDSSSRLLADERRVLKLITSPI